MVVNDTCGRWSYSSLFTVTIIKTIYTIVILHINNVNILENVPFISNNTNYVRFVCKINYPCFMLQSVNISTQSLDEFIISWRLTSLFERENSIRVSNHNSLFGNINYFIWNFIQIFVTILLLNSVSFWSFNPIPSCFFYNLRFPLISRDSKGGEVIIKW